MGYTILNAMFSTLIFVIIYFLYILPIERSITSFFLLFALNLLSGMIGSWVARLFTAQYTDLAKTGQFVNKQLIAGLIYSLVVFFGLFNFVMDRYIDINVMTVGEFLIYMISRDFLEIVAILLAFKLFVYLFSDFFADKLAFGGGS